MPPNAAIRSPPVAVVAFAKLATHTCTHTHTHTHTHTYTRNQRRGVKNYPEGVSTPLKSSRETFFASKLEIDTLLVWNDQAEVQRFFTIVKHIIIYYLRGSNLKLFWNTRFG